MDNVLDQYSKQEGFQELQEVVRTVVVAYDDRYFRIEVLKRHQGGAGAYTAWIWEERENTWVRYPLAAERTDEPGAALSRALGCLSGETLA